jgi:hypothetical protein
MTEKSDGPKPPDGGAPDDDATVRVPRNRSYGRPTDRSLMPAGGGLPPFLRLIALVLMIVIGVAGWFIMRETAPPDLYTGPGTEAPAPGLAVRLADEEEILAHQASETTVFRFAPNRRVLVLDFASMREQGLMLNRAAALVEKVGLPRERVLRDDELDAAIAASGDTVETFYYGHDYPAAELARFFALADRDGVALREQEEWLRRLLRQEGLLAPEANGALISVPAVGAGPDVDAKLRAAILRHELSHAEFFTNRAYATYVRRFWRDGLDEDGRAMFRRYLTGQNYDPALEDLMANEMQAYLMHTIDPRLFSAAALGVAPETMDRWQAEFLLGMPNGWLRDACVASLPSAGSVLRRPRRRRQRASVSTRTARAFTRRPRRMALSSAA